MADPLDDCPAYVKSRTFYLDTLSASVPYRNVDETVITVPPLAGVSVGFEQHIISQIDPTNPDDTQHAPSSPGWQTVGELTATNKLRSLIVTLRTEAVLYPEVRNLVDRLANSAASDLDQIEAIYDDWADVYFWAAYSLDQLSCWQRNKLARPDKQGWFEIPNVGSSHNTTRVKIAGKWGACRLDLGAEWPYIQENILPITTRTGILEGFNAVSPLFDPELKVRYGYLGDADKVYSPVDDYEKFAELLYDAIKAARAKARKRISELYRHAYETLWCAEYGIAQGESYSTNKKLWQGRYGDMPVLVTPTGPSGGGGGTSPLLPGGPILVTPSIPPSCELFGIGCPPPTQPPGLGGEGPMPPIEEPIPEPAPLAPTKWYGTVAGKIGIGVGAVTVLAGGYYGIQYARTRA